MRVVFSPNVLQQFLDLEASIIAVGPPETASKYVDAIVASCETLADFPDRGVSHTDLGQGLRTTYYRGRTVIAYRTREEEVAILGVYYGGQDYENRCDTDVND